MEEALEEIVEPSTEFTLDELRTGTEIAAGYYAVMIDGKRKAVVEEDYLDCVLKYFPEEGIDYADPLDVSNIPQDLAEENPYCWREEKIAQELVTKGLLAYEELDGERNYTLTDLAKEAVFLKRDNGITRVTQEGSNLEVANAVFGQTLQTAEDKLSSKYFWPSFLGIVATIAVGTLSWAGISSYKLEQAAERICSDQGSLTLVGSDKEADVYHTEQGTTLVAQKGRTGYTRLQISTWGKTNDISYQVFSNPDCRKNINQKIK